MKRVQLTQAEFKKQYDDSIERSRQSRIRNADKNQEYICQKKHGISLVEYNELFERQEGKCAICGIHEDQLSKKGLAIDHDHVTNKVRGLLCGNCNRALGFFKDDIEILKKAVDYLQQVDRTPV